MSIVEWDPLSAPAESVDALPNQILGKTDLCSKPANSPMSPAIEPANTHRDPNCTRTLSPAPATAGLPVSGTPFAEDELAAANLIDDLDEDADSLPVIKPIKNRPLHRLAEVREQQGVTIRNMARRMGSDVKSVRTQEDPYNDVPLSTLYAWQQVLEVPISELLVDDDAPLSAPVMQRAQLVRLMKTAAAIQEKAESNSVRRMVAMLMEQLQEIMPELKDVGPWHTVGQRRTLDDYGRVAEQPISDDVFRHGMM